MRLCTNVSRDRIPKVCFFHLRENPRGPAPADAFIGMVVFAQPSLRKPLFGAVSVVVDRQTDLSQVVGAGTAAGGLSGSLHGREQEANQHPNNGDDDQEFNEGERMTGAGVHDGILQGRITGDWLDGMTEQLMHRTVSHPNFFCNKLAKSLLVPPFAALYDDFP